LDGGLKRSEDATAGGVEDGGADEGPVLPVLPVFPVLPVEVAVGEGMRW
jgi:hypothetical protein